MAEFQWWLLIVGLVVGGTVVGLLSARFARTDGDLAADERAAESTFIAANLGTAGGRIDRATVATILEAHREYLGLPAPDAIVREGSSAGDGHPDGKAHDVGDAGRRAADGDLPEA